MNSVRLIGLLLIALTTFERGNALLCNSCWLQCTENRTTIEECRPAVAQVNSILIKTYFPHLKIEKSDKFNCFRGEVTTKDGRKEELRGCTFASVDLCNQGDPKIPGLTKFVCKQCNSDKCNGSSSLTHSVIFLVVSYLFVLLSQKM